jgi:hypothetical protein
MPPCVPVRRRTMWPSEGTVPEVAGYIRKQVSKEGFADPRFAATMRQFTVTCPDVDLAQPTESCSGRYGYNLPLVLVVVERFRRLPATMEP